MEEEKLSIAIIVAMDGNNLIGKKGDLPWGSFKADLKRFKNVTEGHVLIVGRKTHEAILRKQKGKPLSNRKTIVVSKKLAILYLQPDCYGVGDPETALQLAQVLQKDKSKEVFVAGGADMYRLFLPLATRMYITHIHAAFEGDTYFPHYPIDQWVCTYYDKTHTDDEDIHAGYTFVVWERKEKNDAAIS